MLSWRFCGRNGFLNLINKHRVSDKNRNVFPGHWCQLQKRLPFRNEYPPGLLPECVWRRAQLYPGRATQCSAAAWCTCLLYLTAALHRLTTHLDHSSHCKTSPGQNWSNRWTKRLWIRAVIRSSRAFIAHRGHSGMIPEGTTKSPPYWGNPTSASLQRHPLPLHGCPLPLSPHPAPSSYELSFTFKKNWEWILLHEHFTITYEYHDA
jgi:hypothetical protein